PLREKSDEEIADVLHAELSARIPGISQDEVRHAYTEAAEAFRSARAALTGTFERLEGDAKSASGGAQSASGGAQSASGGALRVLLIGRPYVTFDAVLHSSLPRTFEQLGASVYWQE